MNDPINPYVTPVSAADGGIPVGRSYGGIRRLAYFGFTFLAAIVYNVVSLGTAGAMSGMGNDAAPIVFVIWIVMFFAYLGVIMYLVAQRLINIGSSPWWCLGMFVPILNIFVGVRCLVCPEGYNDHKKLDTPAKIMLGIAIAIILLAIIAIFGVAFTA